MTFPILPANGPSGYNLTRSLRFRSSASAYLNRTMTTATDAKRWTWSGWVKRGGFGQMGLIATGNGSTEGSGIVFGSGNTLDFYDYITSTFTTRLLSTQVFRDPSAWYHIIIAYDTTQATASNRVKMYVNGSQITAFSTATYPALNSSGYMNSGTYATSVGREDGFGNYFDGYLTEVNFIDGQALTPSSFGETDTITGVWKPKAYSGTYGTNGFELQFTDNSALTTSSNVGLGKDFSGNGNYWVTNNISITAGVTYDSMTDVPTLTSATAANFAVLNPLWKGANITLSAANLNASMSATSDASFSSTITITSGKWYWESVITSPSTDYPYIGVATPNFNYQAVGGSCIRSSATGFFKASNATKWNLSSSAYGSSFVANDVMMIAYDADGGKIYFGKNGTWDASSDPAAGTSPAFTGVNAPVTPAGFVYNCSWIMNFGQRPFAYTPPTGFVALNTFNLPTSTIVKGNTVMDATTFTGVTAGATVTNAAGFKPDFVWMKNRSAARNNELLNSVTGGSSTLFSNLTNAEATDQRISSFNSNGFTYTSNSNSANTGESIVGWQWQAGQGTTSSNTNGTITSTVSVNASAGFSVVTFNIGSSVPPATVGHGLGVAPSLIIAKDRTSAGGWPVFHVSATNQNQYLVLNGTGAVASATNVWGSSLPTSSVFGVTAGVTLGASDNCVAYCWTPIAGYSAFGSYTGNGSADGPFVYTGFRPKFVLIKLSSSAGQGWFIYDSARNLYNVEDFYLLADSSAVEGTFSGLDFLSNGFKIRNSGNPVNLSTATYIYAAFAETPFKNSLGR